MTIVTTQWTGRTVMVLGAPGTGKTACAREAARQLAEGGGGAALVCADMGQQSIGVPSCLGLSLAEPHDRPSAMWFIGDVAPGGNLLPAVVGTAQLVRRARAEGAQTVVIDTTGMVEGGVAGALKYHKAVAAGVDCLVALQRKAELEPLVEMLSGVCPTVYREAPPSDAKDRNVGQRRAYRQERYRAYFQEAAPLRFDATHLAGADWGPNPLKNRQYPEPGTVVGLLDGRGFCLAIGLVEKILPNRLVVHTPWTDPAAVTHLKLGKLRLNQQANYAEAR